MARSDMSDLEWDFIKQVLPNKSRGVKRVDDRRVINGIFYVLRTGIPWRDLPSEYGPYTTIYNRFNRWTYAGIWEQGAIDVIPSKSNRKLPKEFDAEIYKQRNKIERFFGRIKASFRRIATRHEKTSQNFMAMVKLAAVRIWIKFYESAA